MGLRFTQVFGACETGSAASAAGTHASMRIDDATR